MSRTHKRLRYAARIEVDVSDPLDSPLLDVELARLRERERERESIRGGRALNYAGRKSQVGRGFFILSLSLLRQSLSLISLSLCSPIFSLISLSFSLKSGSVRVCVLDAQREPVEGVHCIPGKRKKENGKETPFRQRRAVFVGRSLSPKQRDA